LNKETRKRGEDDANLLHGFITRDPFKWVPLGSNQIKKKVVFRLKRKEKSLLLIGVMIGVLLTLTTNYFFSNGGKVIQRVTTLPDTRQVEMLEKSALVPYVVRNGDTLDALAIKYYPDVDRRNYRFVVMKKNNLYTAEIFIGQILLIPVMDGKWGNI